ncbi:PERF protein, partial [Alcedo cyanopectus]|nr:PERF protein [Ceyx cyanopectus]
MASLLLPMATLSLLLSPTSPQCHHARGPSCSKAAPAPGTHALGWGFDVTRLELMGRVLGVIDVPSSPSCHLCRDLLAGGRLRRVPRGVARWHSGRRCHQGTQVAQGTMALATAVSAGQEVARGWKVGLGVIGGRVGKGVVALAGSHSRMAEFGLQRQREDRLELLRLRLSCVHYWSWVSPSARPTADFLRALRGLPHRFSVSTAAAFGELVAAYGTHYVVGARAGGRLVSTTALRSCQASLGATGARQVADCLAIEVAAGGGAARAGATASECRRARAGNLGNASFHETYAERMVEVEGGGGHYDNGDGNTDNHHGDLLYGRPEDFSRWLSSLPTAPGVVGVELRPLHTLLKQGDPRRAALRAAIAHYVTWRGLRINCSHPCGGQRGANFPKLAEHCQCSCVASATVTSSCCSRHRGMGRVTVTVREGEGWRGDHLSATDAYVKAALEGGRGERRTRTLWNQQRPRWDQRLELGVLELPPGTHLRLEVWDSDNGWDDDLLGTCLVTPEPGTRRGLSCFPGGGRLTFDLELTCGPALGGPFCQDYVPQPPSQDGGFYR